MMFAHVKIAVLFLLEFTIGHVGGTVNCIDCADIVFLLDESQSVSNTEFNKQQAFVINIVNRFSIFGPNDIQISVALFAAARNIFYLNEYSTQADIVNAINAISELSGTNGLGGGLKFVRENNFLQANGGMRENCQQILIVVADHNTKTGVPSWPEAAKLRALGVNIFGLGTRNNDVLERELALIASGNDYFFDLNAFNNLDATANIDKIENTICEFQENMCTTCADIVFLLDESTSVNDNEFALFVNFIFSVVNSFDTFGPPNGVQIGMTSFESIPRNHFFLNDYATKLDIVDQIIAINKNAGYTATGDALKFVRETQFIAAKGADRTCPKILIVLIDGDQNRGDASITTEAEAIRNLGINIFAVGVKGASQAELEELASTSPDNSTQFLFNIEEFEDLSASVSKITENLCDVAGPPQTRRCRRRLRR